MPGIGSTTLNDGLTYGNYPYGTRVQDENISLNHADLIEVHGVYEVATDPAVSNADPTAPTMTLSSLLHLLQNLWFNYWRDNYW